MDDAPGMQRIIDCIKELAEEIVYNPIPMVEPDLDGFEELMNS